MTPTPGPDRPRGRACPRCSGCRGVAHDRFRTEGSAVEGGGHRARPRVDMLTASRPRRRRRTPRAAGRCPGPRRFVPPDRHWRSLPRAARRRGVRRTDDEGLEVAGREQSGRCGTASRAPAPGRCRGAGRDDAQEDRDVLGARQPPPTRRRSAGPRWMTPCRGRGSPRRGGCLRRPPRRSCHGRRELGAGLAGDRQVLRGGWWSSRPEGSRCHGRRGRAPRRDHGGSGGSCGDEASGSPAGCGGAGPRPATSARSTCIAGAGSVRSSSTTSRSPDMGFSLVGHDGPKPFEAS